MGNSTSLDDTSGKILFSKAITSVREHLRIPLFANAYLLVANQVAAAGLGLLYWTLAARLYPVSVVGENSALISSVIFLAMLAELSLKGAMTRFVPRAGRHTLRLILITLSVNVGAALLISAFLIFLGKRFSLTANLLTDIPFSPFWLILAAAIWTVYYVQDGILTGMRQAKWVLVKNASQSIAKIVLLIIFLYSSANFGLVISWFLPAPVIVLVFGALIVWRFLPELQSSDLTQTRPLTKREIFTSIGGDYFGGVLAETSTRLLPLLVISVLGKEATAYFNQAWVVATPLYLVATNMSSSFVVEASANMQQISLHSRQILRQMALLLIPAVLVLWIGAPVLLQAFGKNYAEESFNLLRWLILATLPFMFSAWYLSYARVLGKAKAIILVQAAQLVIMLGLSYVWLPIYGINGIGAAWVLTQSIISLIIFIKVLPVLWPAAFNQMAASNGPNRQALRRVDWRFFLPHVRVKKSFTLGDAILSQAVTSISDQTVALETAEAECDLVAIANPNTRQLIRAAKTLRPEGHLYAEWTTLGLAKHLTAPSQLAQAGFTWVNFYLPFPNLTAPRFWIPWSARATAAAHLAWVAFPGTTLQQRLLRWLTKLGLKFVLGWGIGLPLCALAGKSSPQTPDISKVIQQEWQKQHPTDATHNLYFLLKTGGVQLSSKVIYLVFKDASSGCPDWVVKIPRIPEDTVSLQHENFILQTLASSFPSAEHLLSFPSLVFTAQINNTFVAAQTAVPGTPLLAAHAQASHPFRTIASLLTDAQIALAQVGRPDSPAISQDIIAEMLASLPRFFASTKNSPSVEQSRAILESLPPLPIVFSHNDFAPWNMYQLPHALGIFDWSDASLTGLPLIDLVYGLTMNAFELEKAHTPESIQQVYLELLNLQTPNGQIFEESLRRYARQVGLDAAWIAPLRLLTWVRHSLNEISNRDIEQADLSQPFTSVCAPLWDLELQRQKI